MHRIPLDSQDEPVNRGMERPFTLTGKYMQKNSRHVSSTWPAICAEHEDEFPAIRRCEPGTFNVLLSAWYIPPNDAVLRAKAKERGRPISRYVDGNHLSPHVKVVEINSKPVEAWLYRGGHRDRPVLELISPVRLAEFLQVQDGDALQLVVVEVNAGTEGMPAWPPDVPGKI